MTLIEKLSNLGGIVDRDEMAKACSEIPDEDLRLALMTLALTYNCLLYTSPSPRDTR